MNLGSVAIRAFFTLAAIGGLAGFVLAALIARQAKWRTSVLLGVAILCAGAGAITANILFHHPLFRSWHQQQNTAVPQGVPCLSYEPAYEGLEASYTMTQEQFLTWVQAHPWKLGPTDRVWFYKSGTLVQSFVGLKYATRMSDRGSQFRAYHEGTTAYISYNAW
jgi:hypothetical protein